MTAIPEDIGPGLRRASVATWADAAIKARYPSARDGSLVPAEGFCDSIADAQILADARGALLGVERRRFVVEAGGLAWPDPAAGIPILRLIDPALALDTNCLAARIELDLENERTAYEAFG